MGLSLLGQGVAVAFLQSIAEACLPKISLSGRSNVGEEAEGKWAWLEKVQVRGFCGDEHALNLHCLCVHILVVMLLHHLPRCHIGDDWAKANGLLFIVFFFLFFFSFFFFLTKVLRLDPQLQTWAYFWHH